MLLIQSCKDTLKHVTRKNNMKKIGRKLHLLRIVYSMKSKKVTVKDWGSGSAGAYACRKPWVQFPAHKQNTPKKLKADNNE